jgi:hypothetical protein
MLKERLAAEMRVCGITPVASLLEAFAYRAFGGVAPEK